MGKGFSFVARQKRLLVEDDEYFADLVFYNRLLRSFVVIELKTQKLTHQDLGQLQMYVNYYDRYVKTEDENPTIHRQKRYGGEVGFARKQSDYSRK